MSVFLQVLIVLFAYFLIFYLIAQFLRNNSIVDIGWGLGFVVVAVYTFLVSGNYDLTSILTTVFVTIWGMRLFYHIIRRNWKKPEDYRYVNMRKNWEGKIPALQAFIRVFMLQMTIMYVVSLPVIVSNSYSNIGINVFTIVGALIWIIGFLFEVSGDYQLKKFKKNPDNKGRVMTDGIWKYTRHPNYFGETAMWTGLFIMSIPKGLSYITFISPLTMTFVLYFISTKVLEKRYEGNAEYQEYSKHTNKFFPWFPRNRREDI